jgi:DNA-binding response OmpR family regulator/DNA-binding CsgD family transcriptional regulator
MLEGNRKILIVDDEADNTKYFRRVLEWNGYCCIIAEDGETALRKTSLEAPDIIILDWLMPELSGIDVLKKLKNNPQTRYIPVIMATGVMMESNNLKTALEEGAADFIRKPVDSIELTARVNSVLSFTLEHEEKLALEKKIFIEQEEALRREVISKEKELVSNSVQLSLNNQLVTKMIGEIEKIVKKINYNDKAAINRSIYNFRKSSFEMNWSQFEMQFMDIHAEFSSFLRKNFPDLSSNEIKLCLLFCMNLTTKDISALTFISYEGVRKARTRLRKKLALDSETDLIQFLQSL